eukprot:1144953-Rhodomonas_salina.1
MVDSYAASATNVWSHSNVRAVPPLSGEADAPLFHRKVPTRLNCSGLALCESLTNCSMVMLVNFSSADANAFAPSTCQSVTCTIPCIPRLVRLRHCQGPSQQFMLWSTAFQTTNSNKRQSGWLQRTGCAAAIMRAKRTSTSELGGAGLPVFGLVALHESLTMRSVVMLVNFSSA